ncbi:MAG TPA: hypothetical protein VNW06_05205 [Cytophagaceae bacterium]|jgi:hypothetical protein|nr:hypothetical protein [Cytophagaceae bacterium]
MTHNEDEYSNSFHKELDEYRKEYELFLLKKYKPSTINKHSYIINSFIDFIILYEGCEGFEQLTKGMVNSKFFAYLESEYQEGLQKITVKNIIKAYLLFIYDNYGYGNVKLLNTL